MKTFETEKGNIPEGATHYADETNADYFAWVKFIDGDAWRIMPDSDYFNEWEKYKTPNTKLIPQTKGVEWVNGLPPVGVECEFKYKVMTDADWKFCRVFGYSEHVAAVWYKSHDGETKHATIDVNYYEFRKPETEAERKEREEIEARKRLIDSSELPNSSKDKVSAILTMVEDVYGSGALFSVVDLLEGFNCDSGRCLQDQ